MTALDDQARATLAAMPAHELTRLLAELRSPDELTPRAAAASAVAAYQRGMSVKVVDALKKALAGNNADSADETGSAAPADDTDPRAAAARALRELRAGSPNATKTAVAGINLSGTPKYYRANAEAVISQYHPLDTSD